MCSLAQKINKYIKKHVNKVNIFLWLVSQSVQVILIVTDPGLDQSAFCAKEQLFVVYRFSLLSQLFKIPKWIKSTEKWNYWRGASAQMFM